MPVLIEACLSWCQPGGISPFLLRLLTFETAAINSGTPNLNTRPQGTHELISGVGIEKEMKQNAKERRESARHWVLNISERIMLNV